MNKELSLYNLWCEKAVLDPELQAELLSIKGNDDAIKDRFYRDLEFGTGGLRGVIGAGTFRLNVYTIRRATQGLADYVNETYENPCMAIAHDSRINSDVFTKAAACVLAANGIKVYLYKELMPTPMLSFAVRYLKCNAGIVVTASHNPAKYNGYKVYGDDGCQMTLDAAEKVLEKISSVDMFEGVKDTDFDNAVENGMIEYIGDDVINAYFDKVVEQGINTELCASSGLKVVYTPLNGTGNKPVRAILKRIGINDVTVVPEQENPDGHFPTCPFPNPEIREALALGLELCEKCKPDLLLATDPDADRMGIAVRDNDGKMVRFNGNQTGSMLTYYILTRWKELGKIRPDDYVVKTIVTTETIAEIAHSFGVKVYNVLTGFKYIAEVVKRNEGKGEFICGGEESFGFNVGEFVRDKDAQIACSMVAECAAWAADQGMTLYQLMQKIYKEYGYRKEGLVSIVRKGISGAKEIQDIMSDFRNNPPAKLLDSPVVKVIDYLDSKATGLPVSNVLQFFDNDGDVVSIRPSGTEPKIKFYFGAKGDDAETKLEKLKDEFVK